MESTDSYFQTAANTVKTAVDNLNYAVRQAEELGLEVELDRRDISTHDAPNRSTFFVQVVQRRRF